MGKYDDLMAGYEVDGKVIPESPAESKYADLAEGYEVNGKYIETQQEKQAQQQQALRAEVISELNEDIGAWESLFINMGRGITNVGRGVGLVEPEPDRLKEAFTDLQEKRPYTSAGGEIAGEVLPFVVPGAAVSNLATLPARMAAGGALGASEGGILANAKDKNVVQGALVGLSLGAGMEGLAPVVGRLGRKIFARVTGSTPKGAILDNTGNPTPEFQQALDTAGIQFEDLTADAREFLTKQKAGSNAEQASRAAQFANEGIPASRGDITQNFADQAVEQKLLQSASDPLAEKFRQFKLQQSEAIKQRLQELTPNTPLPEETGELIKEALTGRKKLLRTQKNALYEQAAQAADKVGGIPLFTDNIIASVPDADTLEDLAITAPQAAQSLQGILKRYGIIEPTPEEIEAGFKAIPLDLKNFERFRKSIKAIERGDNTNAITVATGPITEALDTEAAELAETLAAKGFGDDIVGPLKEARSIVRQMKTEFSPQSMVGRLVDTKKDGVTNIVEASGVYNKLAARSMPVENVRKTVNSLKSAGVDGEQALASLQATTLLDLINAGFSTPSRKIDGVNVFNPGAFKRRMEQIGDDKLKAIFANNPQALKRLSSVESLGKLMTPDNNAVPKGSAAVLMDALNRLGLLGITSKIPGGGLLIEGLTGVAESGKTRRQVAGALESRVDVKPIQGFISDTFPGIATAAGISVSTDEEQQP